jgi:hypothetical protein
MPTDVIQALENEQGKIESLFDDVRRPDIERPPVLQEIVRRVSAYIAVEQNVVLPVVKQKVRSGHRLARTVLAEHHRLEKILVRVEHRKANSPDMPDLVTELLDAFKAHAKSTGSSLFPALRKSLPDHELVELGQQVAEGENIIKSHPHPHLLSLGPANRVLLPLAAFIDRLRDRTVDNP